MDEGDDIKLTSFRPLSPDDSKSSFSLARFFQRKRPQVRVEVQVNAPSSSRQAGVLGSQRSTPQPQQGAKGAESWSSPLLYRKASGSYGVGVGARFATPGYRNISAVLGRLSAAADGRGQLCQEYKESNFKQYWMPDENCKECYECGEKFNTFRRRHHCRLCGQIFCYRCCYMEIPGKLMGYTGFLRVCTYCFNVVRMYMHSSDLTVVRNAEQPVADCHSTSSDPEMSLPCSSTNLTLSKPYPFDFEEEENFYAQSSLRKISNGSVPVPSGHCEMFEQKDWASTLQGRRPFDAFGVCAAEADMLRQDLYRELWHKITSPRSGLELQSHRFRLKTYQNCLVGSELVDWLLTYEKATTRNQAVAIGQGLLDYCWLEPVPNSRDGGTVFKDEYVLYQPGMIATREASTNKRSSFFGSDKDKVVNNNDVESSEAGTDMDKNDDDDDDEMVPHWFRQLEQYGIEPATEETDGNNCHEENLVKVNNIKATGPKLLDLDLMNGIAVEEGDSELSLKVDLQHFGQPGRIGGMAAGSNYETRGSKLSLITDAPPAPLEQYVYSTPLKPSTRKGSEGGLLLSTSTASDEIFTGAVIARKIGVDKPTCPEPDELREDNGERLAMERLRTAHNYHLTTLLEQLLMDAGLSVEWRDTILPLVKIVSQQVSPDVHKDDNMDICQYVKFKKIPGGSKSDCEMISGVVFTKNIANKKMASKLSNPKILALSCAIDYQRNENRLASLDPLVLQEFDFLKNFVARVVSLRPNVLLVEKTVSRLAQDMLLQHGITVVLNVKPEVIERIARCTRADVLRSMEQLSRPQLGSCQSLKVQRYYRKNGESKTLIFIEGCPPDLGCTVNLRGGNSFVLAKVKRIFQHMVYVAYSLKLELHFLMDEFAMPPDPPCLFEERYTACRVCSEKRTAEAWKLDEDKEAEVVGSDHDATAQDFTEVFCSALKGTILSSSPFLEYPLPYLLTESGKNCAVRPALPKNIYWSARLDAERSSHPLTEKDLEEFDFTNPCQRRISKDVCVLEPHRFVSASLTMDKGDRAFQALLSDFRAQGGQIHLTRNRATISRDHSKWRESIVPMTSSKTVKTEGENVNEGFRSREIVSEKATEEVTENKQFTPSSSSHCNRKVDCLDPFSHQRIAVLFSSYSSESSNSPRPCISPWAVFMEFYRRNDITLGGFLEIYCFRPSYICPNPNCGVPMVDHVRYFAHGTGSVYIHMRNLESPIPGFQHTILTWNWCKECKQVTPIVPLSPEAWALSFAKYLELRFYADCYQRRASVEPCGHSLHKDHYQYFAYANMVASFKYRSIKLFETAIPPPLISIKEKARDASYWLNDLQAMATRGDSVFAAFHDRLDSFQAYSSQFNREGKIEQFILSLNEDHERFYEQVRTVEKKAESLKRQENPLAMQDSDSFDQLGPEDRQALEYVIADSLNSLKKALCHAVDSWNSRLQEFVQVEKKKNIKPFTTSLKEGKLPPDVKSTETQGTKSCDPLGIPGEDLRSQDMTPSPALSPSLTPWGSRTASPYPSPLTSGDSPEVLTSVDDEVSRTTCLFRPVVSPENSKDTHAESPTDGILPVGGVVKDHPMRGTGEPGKLPRVTLESGLSGVSATEGSLKGFVIVTPSAEEYRDGNSSISRQHANEVGNEEAQRSQSEWKNVPDGNKKAKEAPQRNIERIEKPYGGSMEWTEDLSTTTTLTAGDSYDVSVERTKRPYRGDAKEPSGGNMDGAKEHSRVKMDKQKERSRGSSEDTKMSSEGEIFETKERQEENMEDTQARFEGVVNESVENSEVLEENKRNERQDELAESEQLSARERSEQDFHIEKIHSAEGTADKDIFCQKVSTLDHLIEGNSDEPMIPKKTFILGHRRVASSPLNTTMLLDYNRPLSRGGGTGPDTSLERSRSDSDINLQVKQNLDASVFVEGNLDQLNTEEDYSMENLKNCEPGKEGFLRGGQPENEERTSARFKKVNTVPRALHKKAPANETVESGVTTIADGTTGISKRGKVKHIISSFMSGPAFQPVPTTFPNHEHHLLPPGEKVIVVVSEKETSSIIAYTLSTKEYNERLHEIQRTLADVKNGTTNREQQLLSKSEVSKSVELTTRGHLAILEVSLGSEKIIRMNSRDSQKDYVHLDIVKRDTTEGMEPEEETSSMSSVRLEFIHNSVEGRKEPDQNETQSSSYRTDESVKFSKVKFSKVKQTGTKDDSRTGEATGPQCGQMQDDPGLVEFGFQRKVAPMDFHFKHQFSDNTTRFYCSIYYAEQFRNLRKRIFSDGEERYIRSLQHSVAWGARGGKSGSAFFKSLDDRFVMKQMSRLELQSFLEFAPHYFRYINKALDDQRPTLLAKILGIYRIGYKNSQSNATMRQDVLVMENLFYDRKIDKAFDLKGSMRGRYVQISELRNEVLMDENLLEMIREQPIFFRPHSKAVLSRAIHNDTEFLAQQMVMDYSLLVGIDEAKSELVIGIIDFIRTFTWDKKLEMYVKSSGILGGQGRMPTVVSPELYRTRFTEAMHRYFLMVPDKWTGLGNDLV